MKFLVTATPVHVPLLAPGSSDAVRAWHDTHSGLGCLMRVHATGALVGVLESGEAQSLEQALATYPERGCYRWEVQVVEPMADACTQEQTTRRAAGILRPVTAGRDGSLFPDWMSAPGRTREA